MPLHTSKLDHVYKYSDRGGRAWPHDIALTSEGRPRIVYTRRVASRDTFYYAYHNGTRWVSRKIVEAGAGRPSFHSGGATLDHEDPRFVYLSRTIGRWNQVEQWFTPDEGRTWTTRQLTADPDGYAIRPVTPRGLTGRQPDPLRLGRRAHDRLHRLHDARPRARLLALRIPASRQVRRRSTLDLRRHLRSRPPEPAVESRPR